MPEAASPEDALPYPIAVDSPTPTRCQPIAMAGTRPLRDAVAGIGSAVETRSQLATSSVAGFSGQVGAQV